MWTGDAFEFTLVFSVCQDASLTVPGSADYITVSPQYISSAFTPVLSYDETGFYNARCKGGQRLKVQLSKCGAA